MTSKEATNVTGGLSNPSKMPGFAYNLPATSCRMGSVMHKIPGSVCSKCYARKGRYGFPNVKTCLNTRLESLNHPKWVEAMALLISEGTQPWFRWHDSGDLQSLSHFKNIIEVVKLTPLIKHWLPTKEYGIVREYLTTGGELPSNLNVRLSSHMLSFVSIPDGLLKDLPFSSVGGEDEFPEAVHCAVDTEGKCGECRSCWNKNVRHIHYKIH